MALFRRKPLHQKLAERGGLVEPRSEPVDPRPLWGEVGIHGVARARRWDAVATAQAPGLGGHETEFVVLPDGTLLGDRAQVPLADALELEPPYRAEAVRRDGDLWAVAARRIDVVRFRHAGEEIELSVVEGERTLLVDGERDWGSIPELEQPQQSYAVHARRLDGDLWELRVSPL